jgi:hypothetical protein
MRPIIIGKIREAIPVGWAAHSPFAFSEPSGNDGPGFGQSFSVYSLPAQKYFCAHG